MAVFGHQRITTYTLLIQHYNIMHAFWRSGPTPRAPCRASLLGTDRLKDKSSLLGLTHSFKSTRILHAQIYVRIDYQHTHTNQRQRLDDGIWAETIKFRPKTDQLNIWHSRTGRTYASADIFVIRIVRCRTTVSHKNLI